MQEQTELFGSIWRYREGSKIGGKIPGLEILKRRGKVYTAIVKNAKDKIIKCKVPLPIRIIYIVTILHASEFKRYEINHSKLCADNHINGINNFRNQIKKHMRKFNGVPQKYFYLFLPDIALMGGRYDAIQHKNPC